MIRAGVYAVLVAASTTLLGRRVGYRQGTTVTCGAFLVLWLLDVLP